MNEHELHQLVLSLNQQVENNAIQSLVMRNLLITLCNTLTTAQKQQVMAQMRTIHQISDRERAVGDRQQLAILDASRREMEVMLHLIA
ncbi:MAG: hypothetical protein P4L95_14610 [Rouxiella aceris]|uniref:hypothetical protein n=1 Tax=Rouxiella aceris TaxID=2703884 RepID=UPI00283C65E1|nr:hypothetical protein [Rouxiella aceris]MDR3433116.1 hypothetical protein [Rouxiella aceris]